MNIVHQNKTNRFTMLFSLYITVEGHYEYVKDLRRLAEHNAINQRDFKSCFSYLSEEGLIEVRDGDHEFFGCLTHKGIKAVEEVFLDVNKPTYYFPAYKDMQG
jgi:predicted transcriptional regulator